MEKAFFYFILLILFTGCSHRIVRMGYQINKADYRNCDIVIKKQMLASDSLQKVGEIKLGETGLSIACSEEDAIEILKNEGCALKANVINITEETRADLWSSCYRCNAEFYRYTNPDFKAQSDEGYQPENINKRVSKDREKNTVMIIGGLAVGFLFGFLFL